MSAVTSLLGLAGWLCVAFSLLTLLPTGLWQIELFSHFRLQYLVAGLLLLIAGLLLRNWTLSVALLLVSVMNVWQVLPWYGTPPAATGNTQLKILHANVLSSNDQYQRALELIHNENPDIVFLQEVSPAWAREIEPLKAQYPHIHAVPRDGNFGILALSRLPLADVRHVDSPPFEYPTIVMQLAIDDETLTLISTHPTIPVNKRLFDARNRQLDSIAELVNAQPGPVILVGDLNASLWDPRLQTFEERTGLKNARAGFGVVPTWPSYLPIAMIPIDHAMASESVGVTELRSGAAIGSDHLPLVVTFSL